MENSDNPIIRFTFNFSLHVIQYVEELEKMKKFVFARQLLASGTSIGANVNEAQSPQSKRDFNHKMKIAFKELLETDYWLQLCEKSDGFPLVKNLPEELLEIRKVLNSIIATSTKNIRKTRTASNNNKK